MDQLPEPKRQKIRQVVLDILGSADLETATEQSVRTTAAERLGIDIFDLQEKHLIRHVVESFLLSIAEDKKRTKDFVPEEQQLTAEPPQQEAHVSLLNRRFVDSYENNGRLICKLSDKRSVGILGIQGKPFVSVRDIYEKDGKLVPSARNKMTPRKRKNQRSTTSDASKIKRARTQTPSQKKIKTSLNELAEQGRVLVENEVATQSQSKDGYKGSQAYQVEKEKVVETRSQYGQDGDDMYSTEKSTQKGTEDRDHDHDTHSKNKSTEEGTMDADDDDHDHHNDNTISVEKSMILRELRSKQTHDQNAESSTAESSGTDSDPNRPCIDTVIRSFSIEKYNVKMPLDEHKNLCGEVIVKSGMGKSWKEFRKILREQKLEKFFRCSCFGHFLNLPDNIVARFQMTMVNSLLHRRVICKKKEEVWINYCGMPVCFGMKEFALVTGLRCHPLPVTTDLEKAKNEGKELVDFVGKSFKEKRLLALLTSESVSRDYKKSLCLVWFVHNILCARDVNKNVEMDWVRLSANKEAFNAFPWGRESFKLTIEYLLREMKPSVKTINLYGFPWAFMAWAFEAIPHLRHQVKDFSEDVSCPRILRWLAAKSNKPNVDLFQPPRDAIVHPFLVPTKKELKMENIVNFVSLESCFDELIDNLKNDLTGATSINRTWSRTLVSDARRNDDDNVSKAIDDVVASVAAGETKNNDEHNVLRSYGGGGSDFGGDIPFGGVDGRVLETPFQLAGCSSIGGGTSKVRYCSCECHKCKENMKKLTEKIDSLVKVVDSLVNASERKEALIKKLISKRGIRLSSKISSPCVPSFIKRKAQQISKAVAHIKEKTNNTPKKHADDKELEP